MDKLIAIAATLAVLAVGSEQLINKVSGSRKFFKYVQINNYAK